MEQDFNKEHWEQKKCPQYDCRKKQCECGLEKVFLSAALGDDSKDSPVAPKNGEYCNAIVVYEANGHVYIYSQEGIPTLVESEGTNVEEIIEQLEGRLDQEVLDRQAADNVLQGEIDDIKNSPDVVDIVATYAALQAYDTSKLGDNDIVRVLQDEQHDGQSTYYRWNKQSSTWTYIGAVGDYYTKSQVDNLLDDKQDKLTAGANITIDANNEISATDTTYTHFTGATAATDGTQGLVPGPLAGDEDKFLKADGTWATAGGDETITILTSADYNYPISNPNSVSLGLLDKGFYRPADDTVYIYENIRRNNRSICLYYVSGTNSNNTKFAYVFYPNADVSSGDYKINTLGYDPATGSQVSWANKGILSEDYIVDNLNSSASERVLSAKQGKALKEIIDGLIIKGAGAPTTSTVGTVGKLYEDTTNGKLYQCTAVSGSTYTWTEIGAGGGGGDTVYSDKTTSSSSTGGAVYIGNLNSSQQEQPDPTTTDNHYKYYWALPLLNTNIPEDKSVNIMGTNAKFSSVVIGSEANNPIGTDSVAIGGGANVRAQDGVSIGHAAYINNNITSSVALGSRSAPTRTGEVNIGNIIGAGYNGTNYRVLGGVHDPVDAHDAATKGYVDSHAGGPVTLLTSANYNWDSSGQGGDPDAIAGWLLNDGWYITDGTTNVYLSSDSGYTTGVNTLIQVNNGGMSISAIDSGIISFNEVNTADGTITGGYVYPDGTMGPYEFYMSDWGDYIKQIPRIDSGAPDISTEGALGLLYTDADTMHTYQCTAIDDTDPDNIEYTWTQRW